MSVLMSKDRLLRVIVNVGNRSAYALMMCRRIWIIMHSDLRADDSDLIKEVI